MPCVSIILPVLEETIVKIWQVSLATLIVSFPVYELDEASFRSAVFAQA